MEGFKFGGDVALEDAEVSKRIDPGQTEELRTIPRCVRANSGVRRLST